MDIPKFNDGLYLFKMATAEASDTRGGYWETNAEGRNENMGCMG